MKGWERVAVLAIASSLWAFTSPVAAQVAGTVTDLKGAAEVQRGGGAWQGLSVNAPVSVGDHLRTGAASSLTLTLTDESRLVLDPESDLTIDEQVLPQTGPSKSSFNLAVGKADAAVTTDRYKTPGSLFEVKTRTAVAGVRGSEWFSQYDPSTDTTTICVVKDQAWYKSAVTGGDPQALDEGKCVTCPGNGPCVPAAALGSTANTAAIAGAGAAGAAAVGVGIAAGVTGGFSGGSNNSGSPLETEPPVSPSK